MTHPDSELPTIDDNEIPEPDDETTGAHHEIPSFVGQPPSNIPGAPAYMQELFAKLDEISDKVAATDRKMDSVLNGHRAISEQQMANVTRLDQGDEAMAQAKQSLADHEKRLKALEDLHRGDENGHAAE